MEIFPVNGGARFFPGGGVSNPGSRLCSYCDAAPAMLYCVADNAFFCVCCDAKLHVNNPFHQRVFICDVCEQNPAVVASKADAAALSSTCDSGIHSANPFAEKQERVSLAGFYQTAENMVGAFNAPSPMLLESESSENFFHLNYYRMTSEACIAPSRTITEPTPANAAYVQHFPQENALSVSSSSIEYGVVPEGISRSELSNPVAIVRNQVDVDREARVLRYKEKKKRRKFEKTIRYESRKAYAELRPRIKGRFVKRTAAA